MAMVKFQNDQNSSSQFKFKKNQIQMVMDSKCNAVVC